MSLFKCLVPVLVLLLVEGSSARPAGAYAEYNDYPPTGQQPAVMVQNGGSIVHGNGRVISIGIYNRGSSGTFEAQNPLHVQGPQAPGVNGNGQGNEHPDGETTAATAVSQSRADGEATVTANSETTSGSTGKIEAQNPLHVESPQAPAVNGNGQGNGHPGGETTAAIAVSQSRVNHSLSQPGQWIFVPFEAANAEGGAGPSTFGGYGSAYGGRVPGANSASTAGANAGSSGVGGSSVGNGNAAANAEATPTANSETTSGSTGKIEAQNPAVNGNGQGNGHPDGETMATATVSQSRADGEATATANSETTSGSTGKIEAQNPLHVEVPQAPEVNGNGQGNEHPDGETTAATAVSQSRADGEATVTANSETTSGSTGKIEAQNPLHVEGPQAPAVNGNGQGNGHPDGETTAATAVSQSRADGEATATANSETTSGSTGKIEAQNPLHVEGPQAPAVNGNGQENGHPDGETTAATAVSQSRANGEATATANSETTSGSTADAVPNANRQGSSGGLSRAISNANSNASGGSTSSSSKSTANGSGVKSSAISYASANVGANV